jgi:hypothetical protein
MTKIETPKLLLTKCVTELLSSFPILSKMSSSYTGLIEEYVSTPLVVRICDPTNKDPSNKGFILNVKSCEKTPQGVMTIWANTVKGSFSTTSAKAKQHVLDSLEIARLSMYSPSHVVYLETPFYPLLSCKVTEMDKVIEVVKRVMDTYM